MSTPQFSPMPTGQVSLMSARPGPDLVAAAWQETEYTVHGTATSYAAPALPADGRWELAPDAEADFATRVVVRRPQDPEAFNGTLVVEWLNVSSGQDACPDWTYLAEELVRGGYAWAGVSAQHAGVEGGGAIVAVEGMGGGLKGADPQRYAGLSHPGDAFCYDIFTQVTAGLRAGESGGPMAGLSVERLVAVGESQSALTLTSYVNGVQPLVGLFDAFLVHSRPGSAAPLGEPGRSLYAAGRPAGEPTRIRADVAVPVIVLQTETEVLGFLDYLPARQPDTEWLRVWEVAGAAHADKFQIGDFEEFLQCGAPVNRSQQVYVVRAALRHLDRWVRDGTPAPGCDPLQVQGREFVLDEVGNAAGGVRTPAVDVPTMVHTGLSAPDAPMMCRLFGSSTPLSADRLAELYPTREEYLASWAEAIDRAVDAGFVLAEDRPSVLAEADPTVGPAVGPA